MKTKEQPTNPERVLIWRSDSKTTRMCADLKKTCEILNAGIARLDAADLLPGGVTREILEAMIYNRSDAIIKAIEKAANETAADSHAMRRVIAQNLETDKTIISDILRDIAAEFRRNAFNCPEAYTADRAAVVALGNNRATFIPEQIAEYYSIYATGERLDYLNEAHKVFDTLAEFDRKTRIFSRGKILGVADADHHRPGIITIADGKIIFDAAAVADLDNLNADTSTTSTDTMKNIYITKSPTR